MFFLQSLKQHCLSILLEGNVISVVIHVQFSNLFMLNLKRLAAIVALWNISNLLTVN